MDNFEKGSLSRADTAKAVVLANRLLGLADFLEVAEAAGAHRTEQFEFFELDNPPRVELHLLSRRARFVFRLRNSRKSAAGQIEPLRPRLITGCDFFPSLTIH